MNSNTLDKPTPLGETNPPGKIAPSGEFIPLEIALQLCEEIRQEAEVHWDTAEATWCYMCQQETGGDPSKRGILRAVGNRGCHIVNARYILWKG